MGTVEFTLRYTVDLNNPQMVAHAKDAIMDDLTNITDTVLAGAGFQNPTGKPVLTAGIKVYIIQCVEIMLHAVTVMKTLINGLLFHQIGRIDMKTNTITPQDLPIPKFKLGQTVFLVYGSGIKKGYISHLEIKGTVLLDYKDKPTYKFEHSYTVMDLSRVHGCLGISYADRHLFTSKEELLEHMEKSI